MASRSESHLSSRIHDTSGINVNDLECTICCDLLWDPVECTNCHNMYCVECIDTWLISTPRSCPSCRHYAKGKCHPLALKQLSRLQIRCIHQSSGCSQILNYEALTKHENECGYRLQQCSGCRAEILHKDLQAHTESCGSIEMHCPECHVVYTKNIAYLHTETQCLREQLSQRDILIANIREDFEQSEKRQLQTVNELLATLEQVTTELEQQKAKNRNLELRMNQSPSEKASNSFNKGRGGNSMVQDVRLANFFDKDPDRFRMFSNMMAAAQKHRSEAKND